MKGIILAGGAGTRLYPMTLVMAKQLQPIYDKPMIYYPLSFLMAGGIRDILIITTPNDLKHFQSLLGDGAHLGIQLSYKTQPSPDGLPDAFILGEEFIGSDDICLILGDNLFHGDNQFFIQALKDHNEKKDQIKARVFAYNVADPRAYGVIEFDKKNHSVKSIEEKPEIPKSQYVLPGIYIFDSSVSTRSKKLLPSKRRETEIVDLILTYKEENSLGVSTINPGVVWLDTGTPKSLLHASSYIETIEERQGLKVACIEEVAFRMGFINLVQLKRIIEKIPKSLYREYLEKLCMTLE